MITHPRKTLSILAGLVLTVPLVAAGPAAASSRGAEDAEVFLSSTLDIDLDEGTITLPLLEGRHDGATVWYVVTESSDRKDAERRGVNLAPPLVNVLGTDAVQTAGVAGGLLDFAGTVDFSPERIVVPGPDGFPPAHVQAGAKGDADYSPLVTTDGKTVINASQVANTSGLHDAVVNIDLTTRRVTLDTLNGFYDDKRVQYLHQEASIELVAALEGSTWAPRLDAAPGLAEFGGDSARAAIIPVVNGPHGVDDPQRQGLQSALSGEGDPLNITQVVPDDRDYTPVWDVTPAVWTQEAVDSGQRVQLRDEGDVARLFRKGLLVSGGDGPANESLEGLRALPGISNCPVVVEF